MGYDKRFWDDWDSDTVGGIVVTVIAGGLLILAICGIKGCVDDDNIKAAKCKADHHGQPYTVEEAWDTAQNGCDVTKIEHYNGKCEREEYVFVTQCGDTAWDEKVGDKTYRRSVTEAKHESQ